MFSINLDNVEELLFYDKSVHKLLPEFAHLFSQWILARQSPALRPLGKRSILDLMNSLQDTHLELLSKHFGTLVTIDKLDYRAVKTFAFNIEEAETMLNSIVGLDNFVVSRDGEQLYISFWR